MKVIAALTVSVTLLMGQSDQPAPHSVVAVRHWSLSDVTRVAVEVTGPFEVRTDRLHNPERVYFDILNARARIDAKRFYAETVNDKLLLKIRVAEPSAGITRVVLDLAGSVAATTSTLTNPHRLIIELRAAPASHTDAVPADPSDRTPGSKAPAFSPMPVKPVPAPAPPVTLPPAKPPAKTELAGTDPRTAASQTDAVAADPSDRTTGPKPAALPKTPSPAKQPPKTELAGTDPRTAASQTDAAAALPKTPPPAKQPPKTGAEAHAAASPSDTPSADPSDRTTGPKATAPVKPPARTELAGTDPRGAANQTDAPVADPSDRALGPKPATFPNTPPLARQPPKTVVAGADVHAPAHPSDTASADPSDRTPSPKLAANSSGSVKPAAAPPVKTPSKTADAGSDSPAPPPEEIGKAARHTSEGTNSLIRALGLKINRVVIDPGHGGHDQGTEGARGLVEKELVLDVAMRVGKLVQDRMGAEVIYTRTDDTFVPLEGRTALANEKKADLFLSIHANSSPIPRIAGVETYYLNINGSKDAMDVAARENASAQKSIFELQDIIRKITLRDKSEESHEFAKRVQASLYSLSTKNFPGSKDRGVKSAPFVVLIGANMPSVLAEIGFVSNSREESLLKKPDYRQKVAESIYKGMEKYTEGLSHFQVAASR